MTTRSERPADVNPIAVDGTTVNVRIKLSALWASVMFCYIYNDYFQLWQPGQLQGMLEAQGLLSTQGGLLGTAVLLAVPSVMVFLPLVLPPRINRWVNIVLGVFFTLVSIATMFGAWAYYIVFNLVEVALTLTVVGLAWRRAR